MDYLASPYLKLLKNRLDLNKIPFSDRGSRLLVFNTDHRLSIRLAERWFKREGQLSAYRQRPPIVDDFQFTDDSRRDDYPPVGAKSSAVDQLQRSLGAGKFFKVFPEQRPGDPGDVDRLAFHVYSGGIRLWSD